MKRLNYAIILEYNRGFLPGAIRFFMNIWRKIMRLPKEERIPNHVEILYFLHGVGLMTVGAVKGGIRPREFKDEMPRSHWKNLRFFISSERLTPEQRWKIEHKIIEYVFGHRHRNYEYLNFLSWPVYILTFGRVRLSRDTDNVMECYEAVARIYNAAGDYFDDPEYTDIFDYLNNPKLMEVKDWQQEIEKYLYVKPKKQVSDDWKERYN